MGCLENADLEKKKKRRTKGLKFITLASKGSFCLCATSAFLDLSLQGLRFRDTPTKCSSSVVGIIDQYWGQLVDDA